MSIANRKTTYYTTEKRKALFHERILIRLIGHRMSTLSGDKNSSGLRSTFKNPCNLLPNLLHLTHNVTARHRKCCIYWNSTKSNPGWWWCSKSPVTVYFVLRVQV